MSHPRTEPDKYEPENPTKDVTSPPNDMPRQRDKVKGSVRLRWNHKVSVNVTKYRIDKVATSTLSTRQEEPNPVTLTREQLMRKI